MGFFMAKRMIERSSDFDSSDQILTFGYLEVFRFVSSWANREIERIKKRIFSCFRAINMEEASSGRSPTGFFNVCR